MQPKLVITYLKERIDWVCRIYIICCRHKKIKKK